MFGDAVTLEAASGALVLAAVALPFPLGPAEPDSVFGRLRLAFRALAPLALLAQIDDVAGHGAIIGLSYPDMQKPPAGTRGGLRYLHRERQTGSAAPPDMVG